VTARLGVERGDVETLTSMVHCELAADVWG
jgi:hypothetical protein